MLINLNLDTVMRERMGRIIADSSDFITGNGI
jgi:hypothetical protein